MTKAPGGKKLQLPKNMRQEKKKKRIWFLSGTQKTLFCLKRQINLWNFGVISYEPIYEKRQNSVICSLSVERLRSKWQVL